jgi:spore coat polysaccharide biosynthesis predicted glycosyltransferase SpsG
MKTASFLVDAGKGTGLGHLRRSGILFDEMAQAGYRCTLYCQDIAVAAGIGRMAVTIPERPEDLPRSDVLICDSYRIGSAELRRFRARCRVMLVFDDLCDHPIEADLVLNHNIYGETLDYAAVTDAAALTGPACALVDRTVLDAAAAFGSAPASDDVVLSFGGTDDGGSGAAVAALLAPSIAAQLHIVVAPGVTPAEAAVSLAAQMPDRVQLHRGPDLPKLLARSRVYVGAAGVTALEAHVIGLDMVLCVIADNQRLNAQAFGRFGHAVIEGFDAQAAAERVVGILRQPYARRSQTVDGRGAARVVAAIEQALLRKAPA